MKVLQPLTCAFFGGMNGLLNLTPVASLFDFASAGAGKFSFEPVTSFQVQDAEERLTDGELSKVQATSTKIEVEVTGDLSKRELPHLNKRAVDICTTASRKSFIDARFVPSEMLPTFQKFIRKIFMKATPKENPWPPSHPPTSALTVPTLFTPLTSVQLPHRALPPS